MERTLTLSHLRSFLESVVLDNCIEYFAVEDQVLAGAASPEQFRLFFNAVLSLEAALARAPTAEAYPEGQAPFLDLLTRAEPSLRAVHLVAASLSGKLAEDELEAAPLGDADAYAFERSLMARASGSLRSAFAFWLDYARSLDEELGEVEPERAARD